MSSFDNHVKIMDNYIFPKYSKVVLLKMVDGWFLEKIDSKYIGKHNLTQTRKSNHTC